jgi:hypothetical protein
MESLDSKSLELQKALVARYVAGDLSRSERVEFETWLIASPELAAEVEMERKLRRGMLSAARRGWLTVAEPEARPSRRWQMGVAASVLLAATVGVVALLPHPNASEQDLAAVPARERVATVRSFELSNMRGFANAPDITLARAELPDHLVFMPDVVVFACEDGQMDLECPNGLAPSSPQYPAYQLELVDRRSLQLVWRSTPQQPDIKRLTFTLQDARRLAASDYELLVRGISAEHQEVVARFWLQVSGSH